VSEEIVLDCMIKSDSADWRGGDIKINLEATVEDSEYERDRLGELARDNIPCIVRIHQKDLEINTALELACKVKAVRTDHKTLLVVVAIIADVSQENIQKALSLGVLSAMNTPITARFESQQMHMNFLDKVQSGEVTGTAWISGEETDTEE